MRYAWESLDKLVKDGRRLRFRWTDRQQTDMWTNRHQKGVWQYHQVVPALYCCIRKWSGPNVAEVSVGSLGMEEGLYC